MTPEYEHEHSWVLDERNRMACSVCGTLDGEDGLEEGIDEELLMMGAEDAN